METILFFILYIFYFIIVYVSIFLYVYKTKTSKLDYKQTRVAQTKEFIENHEYFLIGFIPGSAIILILVMCAYWFIKTIIKIILTIVLISFDKYL